MSGLISYGVYIPYYRLSRSTVKEAWKGGSAEGQRSVANFDEDSITMAAAAAMDCINGFDREKIDGIYFCSTTSPYAENQCAAHLVWVLGLRRDVMTADFANTLRAGTTALKAAHDIVDAGKTDNILVVAADCRLGTPSSEQELSFGDGAAAFLVGKTGEFASLKGFHTIAEQMQDLWRKSKDDFVMTGEPRWVINEGYVPITAEAVDGLFDKCNVDPKDINRAAMGAPNKRALSALTKKISLNPNSPVENSLLEQVGNTGTPHPLIALAKALEGAGPGDKILMSSYGDGADALLFETTDGIEKIKDRRGVEFYLKSGQSLGSYHKYLTFRQLVERGTQASFRGVSSPTMMWRDRKWVLGLFGSKCNQCGLNIFPPQRVCYECHAKDDYSLVRLADKKAKVFTYSLDMLAGGMDPPIVQTVLEFDDGTRMYCAMTDRDPDEVEIGMEVEMTFRKLHEGAGFNNYFWKCKPVRNE